MDKTESRSVWKFKKNKFWITDHNFTFLSNRKGRLLKERYDLIFFTGGTHIGKIVMKAAAEFLTPVILELGGKNPTWIDPSYDIKLAAKR